MRSVSILTILSVTCAACTFAQDELATFKTEAQSAFVWGEDTPSGAVSWRVKNPLSGSETLKLRYGGIEVSSRIGFEKPQKEQMAEVIGYTTTIVNNTSQTMSVQHGEVTVDGHIVQPLSISSGQRAQKDKPTTDPGTIAIRTLYCFSSGFLSLEKVLPVNNKTSALTVAPQQSLTVSSVIRDPGHYPILCSVDGCFPKGTVRYSIRIAGHDFIFKWPGSWIASCGK
jgi:hypothetical protein